MAFDVPVRGCEHRTLGPLNVVQPRFFLSVLVSRLSHVCLWYCQQGEALHACALTHWLFSHQWLVVMCTATSFSPWFGEVLFEVSEPHTLAGIFQAVELSDGVTWKFIAPDSNREAKYYWRSITHPFSSCSEATGKPFFLLLLLGPASCATSLLVKRHQSLQVVLINILGAR